jgi:hypothetical protein
MTIIVGRRGCQRRDWGLGDLGTNEHRGNELLAWEILSHDSHTNPTKHR